MPKTIYFFTREDKYYQLSNFAGFGFELNGYRWPKYIFAVKWVKMNTYKRAYAIRI